VFFFFKPTVLFTFASAKKKEKKRITTSTNTTKSGMECKRQYVPQQRDSFQKKDATKKSYGS